MREENKKIRKEQTEAEEANETKSVNYLLGKMNMFRQFDILAIFTEAVSHF